MKRQAIEDVKILSFLEKLILVCLQPTENTISTCISKKNLLKNMKCIVSIFKI